MKFVQWKKVHWWLSNISFHLLLFWLQTLSQSIQHHARDSFQAFARINLNHDMQNSWPHWWWTCCWHLSKGRCFHAKGTDKQQQLFPSEPSLAHFNHPGHFQFQIPIPQKLLCLLHLSKSLYLVDQFFPVCILWTWRTNQPCIFSHSMEAAHIHFLHCYRLADFACTLPWVGFLAVKKLILWQHSCTQSLQQKPYVLVLNVVKDSS